MDNSLEAISSYLADNIISLRKKKGLTQQGLAKLAGIPRSTLTYLESGSGNPSLNNLIKLSACLQVSLEELISAPRDFAKHLTLDELPKKMKNQGKVAIYKILVDPIPGMDIEKIFLKVGGGFKGNPHIRGTKEYFLCLKGKVKIVVAANTYILEENDILIFPGDQNHSYNNIGHKESIGISVVALFS